jgi:hypothetical protein
MHRLSRYYYNFCMNIYFWKQKIYYTINIVVFCNLICPSSLKFWVSNKIVICFEVYLLTLIFWGPCIVIHSYNRRHQDALFLNFTLIYNCICTDLLPIIRSLDTVFTAIYTIVILPILKYQYDKYQLLWMQYQYY